jgi:hypothetical protein
VIVSAIGGKPGRTNCACTAVVRRLAYDQGRTSHNPTESDAPAPTSGFPCVVLGLVPTSDMPRSAQNSTQLSDALVEHFECRARPLSLLLGQVGDITAPKQKLPRLHVSH